MSSINMTAWLHRWDWNLRDSSIIKKIHRGEKVSSADLTYMERCLGVGPEIPFPRWST